MKVEIWMSDDKRSGHFLVMHTGDPKKPHYRNTLKEAEKKRMLLANPNVARRNEKVESKDQKTMTLYTVVELGTLA